MPLGLIFLSVSKCFQRLDHAVRLHFLSAPGESTQEVDPIGPSGFLAKWSAFGKCGYRLSNTAQSVVTGSAFTPFTPFTPKPLLGD